MTQTRRRLPHLDIPGCPQFITFRLEGTLPPNRIFTPQQLATSGKAFTYMDHLLDRASCGPTFLKQPLVAQIVKESLQYNEKAGHYQLHAWVIMPNHVHLLLTPHIKLSDLLHSLKGFTARQANTLLARTGHPFWQHESYDHLVRTTEVAHKIQHYIEHNPVRAGLVHLPHQYQYSSACEQRILF